jgi:hypothetical protein
MSPVVIAKVKLIVLVLFLVPLNYLVELLWSFEATGL